MKTTVEIPDHLLREAKATAVQRGLSLKIFLTEALQEKLAADSKKKRGAPGRPPHMRGFGGMRHWPAESQRIQKRIDEEFSRIDPGDWK